MNSVGCDSVVTLDLTINYSTNSTITESGCESYTAPDGQLYYASGQYTAVIPNLTGCDSTITINLTVTNIDSTVAQSGFTLVSNATGNVNYQWIDCDDNNSPIVGAIFKSYTVIVSGNYAVQITNGNCVATSDCTNVTGVGVVDVENVLGISVYPNPTLDILNIDKGENENIEIIVLDNMGKVVINTNSDGQVTTIDMSNYASGVYYVKAKSGEKTSVTKLVKQ